MLTRNKRPLSERLAERYSRHELETISQPKLAKEFNVSQAYVCKSLKDLGIKSQTLKQMMKVCDERCQAVVDYIIENGGSINEAVRQLCFPFETTRQATSRYAKKHGIDLRQYRMAYQQHGHWTILPCTPEPYTTNDFKVRARCELCGTEHTVQIVNLRSGASTKCRDCADAEKHLWTWPVPTNFGGTRACYSASLDRISMPEALSFESRESFCSTWLHEQAHSTGHSSRLDRKLGNQFGSAAYAREELIAELASVLACYRLRIGYDLPQHAAYMSSWAKALKEGGAKELLKVLSEARAAADLIAPEPAAEVEV